MSEVGAYHKTELLVDRSYDMVMNDCASDPNFLTSLRDLKKTVPNQLKLRFRHMMKHMSGPAMMITNTFHLNCFVDNFLSMVAKSKESNTTVVVASLDKKSQAFCLERKSSCEDNLDLRCLDMVGWIGDGGDPSKAQHGLQFDSCDYIKVTWAKPALLYHAAQASKYPVMMIDSDIVVHGDLLKWIEENQRSDAKIVTGDDGGVSHQRANTGITYVDQRSHAVLDEWTNQAGLAEIVRSARGEQEAVTASINITGHMEYLQTIPREIVGQCGQRWSDSPMATHYNCIGKKIMNMTLRDEWQPRDATCLALGAPWRT